MSEEGPVEQLEVWRQADGFWRWRYRNPADGTDLLSNESHGSRDEAERAAARAYPGVRVARPRGPGPWSFLARLTVRLAAIYVLIWFVRLPVRLIGWTLRWRKRIRFLTRTASRGGKDSPGDG